MQPVMTLDSPLAIAAVRPRRSWRWRAGRRPDATASRLVGPACVVMSSVSLHSAAALATSLFVAFGPAGTAGLRFLAGAALLVAIARPRVRGRSAREWAAVAGFAATTAGASVCLFEALARVPLGTAVTLQFLGPLTVAVLGAHRRLDLIWAAAAAGGVVLITGGPAGGSSAGVALALGAAACVGTSVVFAERLSTEMAGFDGLALAVAATAVLLLPLSVPAALTAPDIEALAVAAGVGALGVAAPYAMFFTALRRVGKKTYGVLLSLDPAVATLIAFVLLGQTLGITGALGIALVMAASAGVVSTHPAKGRGR